MSFGTRLKELRNNKHMSQEELGNFLNVGKSSISSYENGTREPSKEAIVKIAEIFGVTTDYLLGNTDIKKNVTNNNDDIALDDGLDGHKIMTYRGKEIPDEDKEILKRILGD